jgi:nucleoside 2-deoxyribosyltransferase
MDRLGWNKEFYGRVRDSLSDELRAGPGYGGTVHIKADTEEVTERDHRKNDVRAFIAMPIDTMDPSLEDHLETIKSAAEQCGVRASRIDEEQSNEKITDRILEAIKKARFVIVDLTKERPNVFFEAGYAHGIGKTPIYI